VKNIIFFNEFHNGDIHMSREYVKDLMNIFSNEYNYYYYHTNSSKILKDINIQHINSKTNFIDLANNSFLVINTWINSDNKFFNGCNFVGYYNLMRQYYNLLNISQHLKPIEYYVPSINFKKYNISNIEKYFKNIKAPHVLFCNNVTLSGQVINFDMDTILISLADFYPDITFVVTNKLKLICKKNVIYAEDIIDQEEENNLCEISYIATFCDSIIGRSSGPYSFSITKNTIFSKKFICICNSWNDCWYLPTSNNILWTNNTEYNYLIKFIKEKLI
jgi:hypothetical protein